MTQTDTQRQDPITVVLEEAVPVRLDWNGVRYYVDARPEPRGRTQFTRVGEPVDPTMVTGWQVIASNLAGEKHAFVITGDDRARWWLTALDP